MKRIITLCPKCKADYREAGYEVLPDYSNKIISPCDKCGRNGMDYYVEDKRTAKKSP